MATAIRPLIFHVFVRPIRKISFLVVIVLERVHVALATAYYKLTRRISALYPEYDIGETAQKSDRLIMHYYGGLKARLVTLKKRPKISIILPVYKVPPALFAETLASVAAQIYDGWELCVVDDASGMPALDEMIRVFGAQHPGKVHHAVNEKNGHISVASNRCLELATGDFVALLDHDDVLMPDALAQMVRFIDRNDTDILYSDERCVDERGNLEGGIFCKPGWSPFFHLACNYTTHLTVYRTDLVRKVGGFRVGFEGAQDHDLMLRATEATQKPVVAIPFTLYRWRILPGSTAKSIDEKPYAIDAGLRAVREACARRGFPAEVTWEPKTFHYRVKFELRTPLPLVSIIIPTKNRPELVKNCLESIAQKSTYPNFEILLVDNGSTDTEVFSLYEAARQRHGDRFRLLKYDRPFNFGAMNNFAAREARGEFLLLLNNDTEILTPDWIEEMLRCAQIPDVGAVGCRLLYPDRTIQHAGLLLTDRWVATHALRLQPRDTHVYVNIANTMHEVSAVTAACLMVRKSYYDDVGGLDQDDLPNGFGDVDLCLKFRRKKLRNVYTPYAELIHHESVSRGYTIETYEQMVMLERWGAELMNDPYLNLNLARNERYEPSTYTAPIDPSPGALNRYVALATGKITPDIAP